MTKLVTEGYTDYFEDRQVRKVTILSYDNNKYARVRAPDGEEFSVKAGYVRATADLTRKIARINWHILGGGDRRNFKKRQRLTTYWLRGIRREAADAKDYRTKAGAVQAAFRLAKLSDAMVEVCRNCVEPRSTSMGIQFIECYPDGTALEFNLNRRRRPGKYLRGYGKLSKRGQLLALP